LMLKGQTSKPVKISYVRIRSSQVLWRNPD
jgi:hypothetical protein